MALFTDDFTGSNDTLLTSRSGWAGTSGYYGVLRLDGSGNLKKNSYSDDPVSAMNSVGSASHRFSAVVGAGFSSSSGAVFLAVAASSRNGWLGIRYDSATPRLEVWSNRVEVGGSLSLVSGLTGQTVAAGDTLAGSFDATTKRLIFSKNGTEIYNQIVTTESAGLTGQSVGIMLQYNTAAANADLLRSWESQELGATADTTAPTLTSASASATSGTTSSGSVTTNEANGTLYWLTNTSSTATATAVKAGSSQAVTATGAQSTSSTGLSPGTTYYTHFVHRDAAGNDSAVLSSASFTTPAPDTTAPTFTGSITVGAKTSSTVALTLPTATDNVAVTGYQYRVDGGAWVDNGSSTAVALSGLAALTSYTIDARAYDAAANVSSTLSVTTSTYRAGASAGSIRTATGPQDGNPAGLLYAFCELLPTSDWVSYSIVSGPTPSGGTLDAQPNGAFSYTGPAPATLVIQPEVNGAASGDPITVTLYDQTAELVADNISAGSAIGGGALEEVPSLSADGLVFALDLSTGAVTPVSMGWPARGVRAIVSPGGVDPEPVKVFEQYSFDREVYEVDFDAKYLAGLDDTADELQAFAVPATVPAESRVAVGQALDSGVVMFAIGPGAPVGVHEVLVKIGTAGGRTKGVIVQIKVDR